MRNFPMMYALVGLLCVSGGAVGGVVTNTDTAETFGTIQAAINDADTLSGHTITVGAGTYNEMVSVTKPLSILGAGAGQSILQQAADFGFSVINVSNVTIRGFTVYNQWNPIWVDSSSYNLIEDNEVIGGTDPFAYGGSGYGGGGTIQVVANFGDSTDNIIRNNTLSNMIIGVKLNAGFTYNVENNTIDGNTITGTNTAIRLRSDGGWVRHNTISNNLLSDNSYGLYVWDNTPVNPTTVSGNTIRNSTYDAIRIKPGVDATAFAVNYNNLADNGRYGANNEGTGTLDATHNFWGMYPVDPSYVSGDVNYDDAIIPEPASIIIWSLLGLACAGFSVWRRRRRAGQYGGTSRTAWPEENRQAIRQLIDRG